MEVEHYAPDWSQCPYSTRSEAHQDQKERSAHYREVTPEPIAVISSWLTDEQFIGFCVGNTLKYLGRYNLKSEGKGGEKDLDKALDYLRWACERRLKSKR